MVKLFDYLVEILRKQDVLIDKYYYRQEPKLCYNANEPDGISLGKLNEKHGNHILLIFGNAYQFLLPYYPIFDKEYLELLNHWKYKVVITPVSFLDWASKEINVLLPEITILPADIQSLLLIIQILFSDNKVIISELRKIEKPFYKCEGIDFEDIEELESYCDQARWAIINDKGRKTNVLFKWIAALAVYPKIEVGTHPGHWEKNTG